MEELLDYTGNYAKSIDLMEVSKLTKTHRKPNKKKEPLSAEDRCKARRWGDGSGNDQCTRRKTGVECYCALHLKQHAICPSPCTTNPDTGKRFGLWLGDIRQPLPWKDDNGVVQIQWCSDEQTALVEQSIQDGSAKWPAAKKIKKTKKNKTSSSIDPDESAKLEALIGDVDNQIKKVSFKKSQETPLKSSLTTLDLEPKVDKVESDNVDKVESDKVESDKAESDNVDKVESDKVDKVESDNVDKVESDKVDKAESDKVESDKVESDKVDKAFASIDLDGNGIITKEEFVAASKRGSFVNHIHSGEPNEEESNEEDSNDIVESDDEPEVDVHYEDGSDGERYLVDDEGNVYSSEGENIGTWDSDTRSVN
jgi:hypothetical protein